MTDPNELTFPGAPHWDPLQHRPAPAFAVGDHAVHVLMGRVVVEAVLLDGSFPRYRVRRLGHFLQFHTSAPFLVLESDPA